MECASNQLFFFLKGTKKEPGSTSSNSFTPTIPPSNFLPDIHSAAQEYLSVWAERDEEANFAQVQFYNRLLIKLICN